MYSFSELISPIGTNEFFKTFWEKEVLLISRNDASYWKKLISVAEVDDALNTHVFKRGELRLTRKGVTLDPDTFTNDDNTIDTYRVIKLYNEGYTLVFNRHNDKNKNLSMLISSMESFFSNPFQTNIYLTPKNSQGFAPHYDSHCVFILQIHGTKTWRIYDREILNPTQKYSPKKIVNKEKEIIQSFTLNPGDLAYIPRGIVHDATTEFDDKSSMHITLGAHVYTWGDFLLEFLSVVEKNDANLRGSIPIGFANSNFDFENFYNELNERLLNLDMGLFKKKAFQSFVKKFLNYQTPSFHGVLNQEVLNNNISFETNFSRRAYLIFQLEEFNNFFIVTCKNNVSCFPINFKDTVLFALSKDFFNVKEVPGKMELDAKFRILETLLNDNWIIKVG